MNRTLTTTLIPTALTAATLLSLTPARAQSSQTAALFSGGLVASAADVELSSLSLGWTFTVGPADLTVTALGFYDDNDTALDATTGQPLGGTAMSRTHDVGIFDDAGTLLVQSTVAPTDAAFDAGTDASGSAGDGLQLVRYDSALRDGATGLTPLTGFVLTAGHTYSIAGVTGGDYYTFNTDTFTAPAGVSYGGSAYYSDPATGDSQTDLLRAPNTVDGGFDPGFFGPDFRFTAAPEPSAWAGLDVGALGLLGLALKARRRAT